MPLGYRLPIDDEAGDHLLGVLLDDPAVLARVITYHDWPGIQHRELTQAIDRLLPGLFPAPNG